MVIIKGKFFAFEYLASSEPIFYCKIALIFAFYRGVVSWEAKFGVIIMRLKYAFHPCN